MKHKIKKATSTFLGFTYIVSTFFLNNSSVQSMEFNEEYYKTWNYLNSYEEIINFKEENGLGGIDSPYDNFIKFIKPKIWNHHLLERKKQAEKEFNEIAKAAEEELKHYPNAEENQEEKTEKNSGTESLPDTEPYTYTEEETYTDEDTYSEEETYTDEDTYSEEDTDYNEITDEKSEENIDSKKLTKEELEKWANEELNSSIEAKKNSKNSSSIIEKWLEENSNEETQKNPDMWEEKGLEEKIDLENQSNTENNQSESTQTASEENTKPYIGENFLEKINNINQIHIQCTEHFKKMLIFLTHQDNISFDNTLHRFAKDGLEVTADTINKYLKYLNKNADIRHLSKPDVYKIFMSLVFVEKIHHLDIKLIPKFQKLINKCLNTKKLNKKEYDELFRAINVVKATNSVRILEFEFYKTFCSFSETEKIFAGLHILKLKKYNYEKYFSPSDVKKCELVFDNIINVECRVIMRNNFKRTELKNTTLEAGMKAVFLEDDLKGIVFSIF